MKSTNAVLRAAFVAALLTSAAFAAGAAQSPAAAAQVTAADAAPFLGDWTLDLQGPNGPGTFDLTVKVEKEKVVGEIGAATLDTQPITDITKSKENLVLRYNFNYEGNPVDAAVYLMPASASEAEPAAATDGRKMKAQIDFAGGAYVMTGTAVKKEKPKP